MASPLEQFAIQNVSAPLFSIGGHPIAVTNSAVFMIASVVVSSGLLYAGAALVGLLLRQRLYRWLLGSCGRQVVFGQHVTLRHPHKIHIGDNVMIDDHCLLDAKGTPNHGIRIGSGVFVDPGRYRIEYAATLTGGTQLLLGPFVVNVENMWTDGE